jgi:hypothetical protein
MFWFTYRSEKPIPYDSIYIHLRLPNPILKPEYLDDLVHEQHHPMLE